jgi:hypothetical protein
MLEDVVNCRPQESWEMEGQRQLNNWVTPEEIYIFDDGSEDGGCE